MCLCYCQFIASINVRRASIDFDCVHMVVVSRTELAVVLCPWQMHSEIPRIVEIPGAIFNVQAEKSST